MATMLDVSRKAGVSKSTVSRVLNGTAKISEATREAVFKAIAELNYRPNVLAQSLSKQETNTIGLVIPRGSNTSQYLGLLIEVCQDMADKAGKFLMIAQVNDQLDGSIRAIRALVDRRCDAVLYYNNSSFDRYNTQGDELSDLIDELPVPLVVMNCYLPRHPDYCVWFDHSLSAKMPVDFLLAQGHKRIAYIAGPLHQRTSQLRLQGYQQALANAGLALDPLLLAEGDRLYSGGYSACNQLLQRKVDFTAICCFNDMTAIGALKALQELAIVVPDEVSLFGFDNETIVDYLHPSVSSVSLPANTFVASAFNLLMAHLTQTALPTFDQNTFAGDLVIRKSVRSLG
jgi:DNA-binding LacI/PurR family transcriptional regulator